MYWIQCIRTLDLYSTIGQWQMSLPDVGNSTTLPQLMAFILSPFMSPSWEVAPKGSQICEIQKNREKICAKKKNHRRQYLRGLVIYLRLQSCRDFTIHREKYKMRQYSFLSKKQCKTLISKITVFLSYAQDLQWAIMGSID